MCPTQQAPPFEEQQLTGGLARQLYLSHCDICTQVRTVGTAIAVFIRSCDQKAWAKTLNMHRKKVVCDQLFVLPGQTLQHFPSTFWGYLQGYCSGQWIFLHSCLVMLQVHNTHSTIPKARRLGCQDSPWEYVLPFETQTTKEEKRKKKYNWKRYVHWLLLHKCSFNSCTFV